MCVIAYKAKNVRFPSESNIREMWSSNPDGAGVMWRDESTGEICFVKGFMKLKKLEKWIMENKEWLENVECALHFRITTHGGTIPGNCHPFAVGGEDSHLLCGRAPRVLMHNGVLPLKPRSADISDTAELALRLGSVDSPEKTLAALDECLRGNRIILMDESGTHFHGDCFRKSTDSENDGILYSNLNWESANDWLQYTCGAKGGISDYGHAYRFYSIFYDEKNGVFRDMCSKEIISLDEVDPYELNDKDYEIWEKLSNEDDFVKFQCDKYGMTPKEYKDLEIEAESCGMCADDYIAMLTEDEEEYAASYAG